MDSPVSVHKQGYLVKKGHIRHSWRTRWFILKKNSLEYFKTRLDSKPKGRISLLGASLNCPVYSPSSERPWLLIITTVEGKEYSIQAPDKETRDDWKISLEEKIRRLDPSKRGLNKRGVTLSRSLLPVENVIITDDDELRRQRDIIEAMQDPSAGIMLKELRRGRLGRHVDKYFTGMEAVEWLITWYFVTTRSEAVTLCNSMLRNGLFHAITEEGGKSGLSKSTIAEDKRACNVFQDSDIARYIFVSFVTSQSVERLLFCDPQDEDEEDEEDILSSREVSPDVSSHRLNRQSTEDLSTIDKSPNDNVIRQGYLLKQGHLRKNWKTRKFVLDESHLYYYRIEKIKTKPQGVITLLGSIISTIEEEPYASPISPGRQKRHSLPARLRTQSNNPKKPHMFCIETKDHTKYIIQAESDEDRLHWMADIAKQIDEVTNESKLIL